MSQFRPQAVNRHLSSDQRGGLLQVAPPWLLAVYVALTLLMLLALGVAIFGRVRIHAAGPGIVRPTLRTVPLRAPRDGFVEEVLVGEGQPVARGHEVVRLEDRELELAALRGDREAYFERERSRVLAPLDGRVEELAVGAGEWVAAGDLLSAIVPDGARLVAFLAVRERDAPWVRAGARVRLKLDAYPYQEMGLAWGRVTRVGGDLLSARRRDELGLPHELADPRVLVEVSVERLPEGAPRAALRNGMGFTGEVILREQRIGVLLVKPLADLLGGLHG